MSAGPAAPSAILEPRVVSLLPSASEIVCALGKGGALVGRSHECDHPKGLRNLPVLTRPRLDIEADSGAIDRAVQDLLRSGLSVYEVDTERLRRLRPDVVITQVQCEVCAVTPKDLDQALQDWIGHSPEIVSLAPDNLESVWTSMEIVAEALEVPGRGRALAGRLRERVAGSGAWRNGQPRPRTACIEWLDPLMTSGHWVPDLVWAAGGEAVPTPAGNDSSQSDASSLAEADPDVVVIMPCGLDLVRARTEASRLQAERSWLPARAVEMENVAVADGHQYFNRPGPRLADSAEILAEVLRRSVAEGSPSGRSARRDPRGDEPPDRPANRPVGRGWSWLAPASLRNARPSR